MMTHVDNLSDSLSDALLTKCCIRRVLFVLSALCLVYTGCTEHQDMQPDEDMSQRVGINTLREPFHKSDTTCGPFPKYYLEYLDDTLCTKRTPSNRDRDFQCPVQSSIASINQQPAYLPIDVKSPHKAEVDTTTLVPFVPPEVTATMILIRRVNGIPHYRYLSNGKHDDIVQTWSSSKFLGIMNASESLRYTSNGDLGLDAYINDIPLGDLVTVVHNYDERRYTSNSLMYWFHDIGGRFFANEIIHWRWLHRPDDEIFGANYGAKPPELGFTFTRDDLVVDIKQDQGWTRTNLLSTFTLAEALKRLVMYRENPETQLEYSTWDDVKVLLYGASDSLWYDEKTPQGMESDVSIYMQQAVDIDQVEQNTQGQWRIFSKLGLGSSRGGEFVHTDYACLPVFDDEGNPVVDQGLEMVISIHLPADHHYAGADQKLAEIYQNLVQSVLTGQLR